MLSRLSKRPVYSSLSFSLFLIQSKHGWLDEYGNGGTDSLILIISWRRGFMHAFFSERFSLDSCTSSFFFELSGRCFFIICPTHTCVAIMARRKSNGYGLVTVDCMIQRNGILEQLERAVEVENCLSCHSYSKAVSPPSPPEDNRSSQYLDVSRDLPQC